MYRFGLFSMPFLFSPFLFIPCTHTLYTLLHLRWTLHDYYGEPSQDNKWPHISSSFGSFDLSGFPKAPAWWYRSNWLGSIDTSDAGRPPLPAASTATFCRLVESWQPGLASQVNVGTAASAAASTRTLTVYTNAAYARIKVNGKNATHPSAVPKIPLEKDWPAKTAVTYSSTSFANVSY